MYGMVQWSQPYRLFCLRFKSFCLWFNHFLCDVGLNPLQTNFFNILLPAKGQKISLSLPMLFPCGQMFLRGDPKQRTIAVFIDRNGILKKDKADFQMIYSLARIDV